MDGSDLHITTDTPPQVRVHGHLQRLQLPRADAVGDQAAGLQRAHRRAEEALRGDAGARLLVRHPRPGALPLQRVQPARRGRRGLPADSRRRSARFGELGLPPVLATLAERPRGLVLVTGPTGSGKSTTLAAMLDKINSERHEHILTIEDPIEYIHQHKNCLVNQREVHSDTDSFSQRAARGAARGSRHRPHRRDARSRDGRSGAEDRRDRPPDVRHAAHQLGGADDQPHHRHLPGRTSSRRSARSCRSCSKASSARRCCRGPTARAASCRSRSWCRRRRSGT